MYSVPFIHIVSTFQNCSFDKVSSAQFIRASTIIIHPNFKNIYKHTYTWHRYHYTTR